MQTARSWEDISSLVRETGVAPVDHDHRQMTEYILELNRVLFELEQNFSLKLIQEQKFLVARFFAYTADHFAHEEQLIRRYHLPNLDRQREEHRRILKMLREILQEFETGRISSAFRLRIRILDWVISHINQIDFETFRFENSADAILEITSWEEIRHFIRELHIPQLDREHQILTQNIIALAAPDLTPKKRIEVLKRVISSAVEHFEHEQQLMQKYNLAGFEEQKAQHSRFLNDLSVYDRNPQQLTEEILPNLRRSLLSWWIQHINVADYRVFRSSNWFHRIFDNSADADDVTWLISRTGNSMIDTDHIRFIELLHQSPVLLSGHAQNEQDQKILLEELHIISDYASGHFLREEELMQPDQNPLHEAHLKEHERILERLHLFMDSMEKQLIDVSRQLKNDIMNWWIEHTNGMDKRTFGAADEQQIVDFT